MVKAGVASEKKAANILDISSMLKKKSVKVVVALKQPNCSRKLAYAILGTGDEQNVIKLVVMDPPWNVAINKVMLQELRFAAETPLRVVKRI